MNTEVKRFLRFISEGKNDIIGVIIAAIISVLCLDIWPDSGDWIVSIFAVAMVAWVLICFIAIAERELGNLKD